MELVSGENTLIIVSRLADPLALKTLEAHGQVIPFGTTGITYDSIACHPDVFFCPLGEHLVVAPNSPAGYTDILRQEGVLLVEGEQPVGAEYPGTARYNAVGTSHYLIHNFRYTDGGITSRSGERDLVQVNQGYTRCNLLPLPNDVFITSDHNIAKVLQYMGLKVLLVFPDEIRLPGFRYGFFGGVCGIRGNMIFLHGSLKHHSQGDRIREFMYGSGCEIVELTGGPLTDVGSIIFLEASGKS
ncbi:MAG: hypothetical protein JW861_13360 [Bacteroidales bacterium]|nr:hypothetical protein [Bacteroidales bacterium]